MGGGGGEKTVAHEILTPTVAVQHRGSCEPTGNPSVSGCTASFDRFSSTGCAAFLLAFIRALVVQW